MANAALKVPPNRYFKTRFSVNENHISEFRDVYRKLSKVNNFDGHEIDQRALLETAQQLGIQSDTDEDRKIL